jgi:hypothetical protein
MRAQLRTALSPTRRARANGRSRSASADCARPASEERRPELRQPALHQVLSPEQRVRRAGGPEDRALYSCDCGYTFEAAVSTTVDCPHCGAEQAW